MHQELPERDMQDSQPEEKVQPSIGAEVQRFIRHVEAMERSLRLMMVLLSSGLAEESQRFDEFLEREGELLEEDLARGKRYRVSGSAIREFQKLDRKVNHLEIGCRVVPSSLLVSLVSQFDFLISGLLRVIFTKLPDFLDNSKRTLTFGQLVEFGSVEAAREFLLEKEIESVLRESHVSQFEWMENKFDLPLRKGLKIWPTFVELTERRNLFVHTDGRVSSQYLTVCTRNSVKHDKVPTIGDELSVSPEYSTIAHECVLELGIKLAHVLWRKLFPQERGEADNNLVHVTYDLLTTRKYRVVQSLGAFARETLKKFEKDESRRVLLINEAIAYYLQGDKGAAQSIINQDDWSSCSYKFHLAASVLKEDYDRAVVSMRKIGSDGEVTELNYRDWPLFKTFRESDQFRSAFHEIFGKEYTEELSEKRVMGIGQASENGQLMDASDELLSVRPSHLKHQETEHESYLDNESQEIVPEQDQ